MPKSNFAMPPKWPTIESNLDDIYSDTYLDNSYYTLVLHIHNELYDENAQNLISFELKGDFEVILKKTKNKYSPLKLNASIDLKCDLRLKTRIGRIQNGTLNLQNWNSCKQWKNYWFHAIPLFAGSSKLCMLWKYDGIFKYRARDIQVQDMVTCLMLELP